MKKAIIIIILLGILSTGISYFITKKHTENTNVLTNAPSTNINNQSQNNSTSQQNPSPSNVSNESSNTHSFNNSNIQRANSHIQNNNSNTQSINSNSQNSNSNTQSNNSVSKVNNNSNNTNTTKLTNNAIDITSYFTDAELNTLKDLSSAQEIAPGAGTGTPVINLNFYSVVNGKKYYAEYLNTIPETNWFMAGSPLPSINRNFSQLTFSGYVDKEGQKITQSQFLNGDLSFNINNTSNLTSTDISNMIRKIAIMYVEYAGFRAQEETFSGSSLNNYNKGLYVNINNTMTIDGQTYYSVEYNSGEPFYISLTGNIFVGQEHYMAKIFPVPSMSNAGVKQFMKGV